MPNNGMLSDILKNLAIGGTGAVTGFLGAIPATISLLATGGKWLSEALNPEDTEVRTALDYLKGGVEKATPESLQGYAEQLSSGYLKPETEIQKGLSEFSQDVGSMVGFGSPSKSAARIAGIGGAAKQAAKYYGASEDKANTAKLIGMVTSPAFKFNNIKSIYKDLYKDAEAALVKPSVKGVLQSKSIRDAASSVIDKTLEGTGKSTAKIASRKIVLGALSKLKSPYTSVSEVWEMNKDINNELAKMGKYTDQKRLLLKPFQEAVKNKLELYGDRNKDFGYAFKNAQTLFGIENSLPFLDKVINKSIGLKDTGLSEYFRKSMAWGVGGMKGLLAKSALGSLSKRAEAFYRSPAYRDASIQLAKASTRNNVPMTTNALRKLANIHDTYKNGLTGKSGNKFKFINEAPSAQKSKEVKSKSRFRPISQEELKQRMNA